jgi:hypothetical protein
LYFLAFLELSKRSPSSKAPQWCFYKAVYVGGNKKANRQKIQCWFSLTPHFLVLVVCCVLRFGFGVFLGKERLKKSQTKDRAAAPTHHKDRTAALTHYKDEATAPTHFEDKATAPTYYFKSCSVI